MRHLSKLLVAMTTLALLASLAVPAAAAVPAKDGMGRAGAPPSDSLPNPLADAQNAARATALELVLQGKATPSGANKLVELGPSAVAGDDIVYNGQNHFVELAQTGEDQILTVLGEFGAGVANHASHLEGGPPVIHTGPAGPAHNEIAEPDRSVDNTTIWTADFSEAYFEDLLFSRTPLDNSMANFYAELSSGAYSVDGDVTDWAEVPNNAASYGSDYCGSIVCTDTWLFVDDSVDAWAATMTTGELNTYLSEFDVWDRYDHDGDSDFNEPDGYIDHFQSVHAGQGQEVGGGAQGADAIWSHRWYAFYNLIGIVGPPAAPFGGLQIGASDYWIGDYTIEPENGGVGVFGHEFAHDLGLPDLYDTAGGENSTAWWTLMSQGSYGTGNNIDIGSKPIHMGAWEKLQLGWLDYVAYLSTSKATVKLGPSMHKTKQGKQALIVVLPDKEVTANIAAPYAGSMFYYSGAGNNLDNLMYQEVTLPGAGSTLTAQVNYVTEPAFDFAYVVVSDDGGATWDNATSNLGDAGFNQGIHGTSNGLWVPLTADLTPWDGQTVLVGFRYTADGSVVEIGFMADEIMIGTDGPFGAEVDDGFTFDPATDGFRATTGTETSFNFNAYIAEFRQYNGYDAGLATSPYNFGFLNNGLLQNWTERFRYQDGLLISYWDTSFEDNNTLSHPGGGLILPIDSHPTPLIRPGGAVWRSRIQAYDSTFGLSMTDAITLHRNSISVFHPSLPAVPLFNDNLSYWNAATPLASVIVPHTGTTIRATSVNGFYMTVFLNK